MQSFPIILHINDVLPYVKDKEEFSVIEKEGYTVINYNVVGNDTFPPIQSKGDAILRECRGLIFDYNGKILSRRFHKFFNIGERDETMPDKLDFSKPHIILEKLDGSMITPLNLGGKMRWGTKAGLTDVSAQVEEWIKDKEDYQSFAKLCYYYGWTPLFEWCSRKQRIVVDYPEDNLILLAIRDNVSGSYHSYENVKILAKKYNIPVVQPVYDSKVNDINSFIERVRNSTVGEGCVITFDDGFRVKLKTDYYVAIHRAKEALNSERKLVSVILNNGLDDLKGVLNEDDKKAVVDYESGFVTKYNHNLAEIKGHFEKAKEIIKQFDRKTFALEYASKLPNLVRALVFSAVDGKKTLQKLYEECFMKHVNNNKNFNNLKEVFFKDLNYKDIYVS